MIASIPDGFIELTREQKDNMLGYVQDGMFLNTDGNWVTDRQGKCWCSPGTTDRIVMPNKVKGSDVA